MGFSLYLDPCGVWAESLPVGGLLTRIRLRGKRGLSPIILQKFNITAIMGRIKRGLSPIIENVAVLMHVTPLQNAPIYWPKPRGRSAVLWLNWLPT